MTTDPAWMPTAADEYLHPMPEQREDMPWKDTWLFPMRDVERGRYVAVHMTVSPNRGNYCRIAISASDGRRELHTQKRGAVRADGRTIGNEIGSLEIVNGHWDDRKHLVWRGSSHGLQFEITVRGINAAASFRPMFPGFFPEDDQNYFGHAEQWNAFEGWMQWDGGERLPLSGECWRDRSWAWRKTDKTIGTGWTSVLGRIYDGPSFGIVKYRNPTLPDDQRTPVVGWLTDRDSAATATELEFIRETRSLPVALNMKFSDGREFRLRERRQLGMTTMSQHDVDEGGNVAIQGITYWTEMIGENGELAMVTGDYGTPIDISMFLDSEVLRGTV